MKKRSRRTPEQQIADLKARIAAIHERAERKKALKDPGLRHVSAALRSIDKALGESRDEATLKALAEARERLAACVSPNGAVPPAGKARQRRRPAAESQADPQEVLRYLRSSPGSRCEDVARALDSESSAVSPVLKALKSEGKVRTEGQARGTKYHAVAAGRR